MLSKTRRKCIRAGSVAASLLLTVLASMAVSRTFSDRQLGASIWMQPPQCCEDFRIHNGSSVGA